MEIEQLNELKTTLLKGMCEYMESIAAGGDDPDYSKDDVGKCDLILTDFIDKVRAAGFGNTESVMNAVKEAVLALNVLNESCAHSLIETDQREQICELIIQAAAAAGVGGGGDDDDITEEWRDW